MGAKVDLVTSSNFLLLDDNNLNQDNVALAQKAMQDVISVNGEVARELTEKIDDLRQVTLWQVCLENYRNCKKREVAVIICFIVIGGFVLPLLALFLFTLHKTCQTRVLYCCIYKQSISKRLMLNLIKKHKKYENALRCTNGKLHLSWVNQCNENMPKSLFISCGKIKKTLNKYKKEEKAIEEWDLKVVSDLKKSLADLSKISKRCGYEPAMFQCIIMMHLVCMTQPLSSLGVDKESQLWFLSLFRDTVKEYLDHYEVNAKFHSDVQEINQQILSETRNIGNSDYSYYLRIAKTEKMLVKTIGDSEILKNWLWELNNQSRCRDAAHEHRMVIALHELRKQVCIHLILPLPLHNLYSECDAYMKAAASRWHQDVASCLEIERKHDSLRISTPIMEIQKLLRKFYCLQEKKGKLGNQIQELNTCIETLTRKKEALKQSIVGRVKSLQLWDLEEGDTDLFQSLVLLIKQLKKREKELQNLISCQEKVGILSEDSNEEIEQIKQEIPALNALKKEWRATLKQYNRIQESGVKKTINECAQHIPGHIREVIECLEGQKKKWIKKWKQIDEDGNRKKMERRCDLYCLWMKAMRDVDSFCREKQFNVGYDQYISNRCYFDKIYVEHAIYQKEVVGALLVSLLPIHKNVMPVGLVAMAVEIASFQKESLIIQALSYVCEEEYKDIESIFDQIAQYPLDWGCDAPQDLKSSINKLDQLARKYCRLTVKELRAPYVVAGVSGAVH